MDKKNMIMTFIAGLALGYVIDKAMTPAAGVHGVSLACDCANGSRCNSGHSDCSCCPGKRGRLVPTYQKYNLPPVQYQITTGI